jgi:hypothetical protein
LRSYHIADLLDPEGKPTSQSNSRLRRFFRTTHSYAPGLFHSYDIPGLLRTNNDREMVICPTLPLKSDENRNSFRP